VPTEGWVAFRGEVLADLALQARLLATTTRTQFVALAVDLAAQRGLVVRPSDVDEAMAEARQEWRARWI
jgi:hypothetical protein